MKFSYNKLWKLLIDRDMNKGDLIETGPSTISIMGRNEPVRLEILGRICEKLDCNIEDMKKEEKMYKFIDLFAGIGGIRLGFDQAFKDDIKTVFVSEWDEKAVETYKANFNDGLDVAGDITKVDEKDIPAHDVLLAGFPCQAFSLAGQKKGFEDTRGTLFFDVARIIKYHKPKVVFCENVKNLVNHDRGRTFNVIKSILEDLGYIVFYRILNSKNFGVPQNRERIYIVGFRKDIAPERFIFPEKTDDTKVIKDIVEEDEVSPKYYLSTAYLTSLKRHKERHASKGNGFGYEIRELDSVAGAIVCGGMGRERNLIIDERLTDFTPITHIKGEVNREYIRKMTPREWARLQGFPNDFKLVVADTHLYKQFGNSVTVPVIRAIAEQIKAQLEKEKTKTIKREVIMLTGNKGEWSEIYVLLRLLADGKIYAADSELNKLEDVYSPIIKIIREENKGEIKEYAAGEIISIYINGSKVKELPATEFEAESKQLLNEISSKASKGAFSVESTQNFMDKILCYKLSAPATDKSDITVKIIDINTGYSPTVGFSIKSELGSSPTLLNAGKTTNFIYKISHSYPDLVREANEIYKVADGKNHTDVRGRINKIIEEDGQLKYWKMNNQTFSDNLVLIDSNMDKIIAETLLYFYRDGINNCDEMVEKLERENPMNYGNVNAYRYKFKKFLTAVALGMKPATVWDGVDEATGGYIVVTKEGNVLAYHIYNRNYFEEYLLKNTKYETASTSRHGFGEVYSENGEDFINLNLQVRFR